MAAGHGIGLVWGISTTGFAYTAAADVHITGQDWGREGSMTEVKGQDGNTKQVYFSDAKQTLSVKCWPSGTSADTTATPNIGELVTITDSGDADIAGAWACESASKTKSNEGHTEFTIGLRRWNDFTVS